MSVVHQSSSSPASKPSVKKTVNRPPATSPVQDRSDPGQTARGSSPHAPALVLVVDDQERNLQMVKKVLSFDGYHVLTAESGEEALKIIAARRPDLILLDVVMPDMDGFEVCEQIKANPATQNVPIIFLSGDTEHHSIMTGFAKGGIDYISKPFNKAELLARVRTHVELHRSQSRHVRQVQERQRTLDIIAHEWHKPLQRISLFLAKVQDVADSTRPEAMIALSKEAMKETNRMLSSIEDFLHQQSPNADLFHEPSSPTGLSTDDLKSMVGKWYVTAKRKLVDLVLAAPSKSLEVSGLPFAVNQIIDAVLSNAVNFTPQSGRIDIKILEENGQVVLRVEDDGPGFSEEYLRRKFQPYMRQGDAKTASTLGVGLAAAKRIADRIHATVNIGNRPRGAGSYVEIVFASPGNTGKNGSSNDSVEKVAVAEKALRSKAAGKTKSR